jgi:broad specificity phosphatase PhoE
VRLLLVRHGETDWNASLRYQGHASISLNARGRRQAQHAAEALRRYGAAALYASDVVRAWETAELIGAALSLVPQPLPGLREVHVGQWEGLTPDELYVRFPDHMAAVDQDPANTVRLGGESYAQMQLRAVTALEQLYAAHRDQTVIAVSHGGPIRALVCHLLGAPLANFNKLWIDNGALSRLIYHPRHGWRLTLLNDTSHLQGVDEAREGGE